MNDLVIVADNKKSLDEMFQDIVKSLQGEWKEKEITISWEKWRQLASDINFVKYTEDIREYIINPLINSGLIYMCTSKPTYDGVKITLYKKQTE